MSIATRFVNSEPFLYTVYVTCGRAGRKTTCIYCVIFCSVPDLGKFVRTDESSEDGAANTATDGSGGDTGELVTHGATHTVQTYM